MNFFYNKNYVGTPYGDLGNDPPTILWVISAYLVVFKLVFFFFFFFFLENSLKLKKLLYLFL